MKKIVIAPDSFKGSLSAVEVADCMEEAIRSVFPEVEVVKIPLGDGGEGTAATLTAALSGNLCRCRAHDPLMRPIEASYGLSADRTTAVIEMAAASGLTLLSPAERDPWIASTYGTGELIRDALERGCRRFWIGIGGSATNDAGTGMLQALGFRFLDKEGRALGMGGKILGEIHAVDRSGVLPELRETSFTVACDVDNPFCGERGAAYVFARQKGADEAMIRRLDEGMARFARLVRLTEEVELSDLPGAGAAGGLGGGFVAFLRAELKPGIRLVLDALRFEERARGADLVLTGEGKIDGQTCQGKAPVGVLRASARLGIPVIALGGAVEEVDALCREGFLAVVPIQPGPVPLACAMEPSSARRDLIRTVSQLMRVIGHFEGEA